MFKCSFLSYHCGFNKLSDAIKSHGWQLRRTHDRGWEL